jgi:hypothetical protein
MKTVITHTPPTFSPIKLTVTFETLSELEGLVYDLGRGGHNYKLFQELSTLLNEVKAK